jgi:hypothetical protein
MDGTETTAPAPSSTGGETTAPIAVTPADTAVATNDVAAYREARRVERGDPRRLPAAASQPGAAPGDPASAAPSGPAAPGAGADPARTVSKRQQTINDYERTVAELKAENARLKGAGQAADGRTNGQGDGRGESRANGRAEAATPRPAGIPVDITQPALEEAAFYTQHPEASTADYVRYLTRFDREVERATDQMRQSQTAAQAAAHQRATKFHTQITAAGDPAEVIQRIDPDLVALETRAYAQAQGKPLSAANDLADEILDSDVALQVLEHLTAHPDVKAKLLALPNRRAVVREFTRLEAQFTPAAPGATAPKTITDAPTPAVTLGTRAAHPGDPVDSAVARGDVAAYRAARLQQRAAQLR